MLDAMLQMFGIAAAAIVIILVVMSFRIKTMVRGKIYCLRIGHNKQLRGELHKAQSETIEMDKGENKRKYLISKERQFWSMWPPGFPTFLQEPVPSLIFVEGDAEALNIFKTKPIITDVALQKISDDAMLRSTWRDVRESVGAKARGPDSKLLYLILIASVISAITGVLSLKGGL